MVNMKSLDRAGFLGPANNNHIMYGDPCLCVSILSSVRSEQLYFEILPIDPTKS